MANTFNAPHRPTREQIEEFRKEQFIPGPDLLPWAIESNMVLNYLCTLALEYEAFKYEDRLQLERELALANARIDYLCSPDSSVLPPEGGALELLRQARDCVAYCVSVDDGSWAQHNVHYYSRLLSQIDALLQSPPQMGETK